MKIGSVDVSLKFRDSMVWIRVNSLDESVNSLEKIQLPGLVL